VAKYSHTTTECIGNTSYGLVFILKVKNISINFVPEQLHVIRIQMLQHDGYFQYLNRHRKKKGKTFFSHQKKKIHLNKTHILENLLQV
jgi:hypothetical protein